jgi:2Fe-2S ferredoxin
MDAAQQCGYRWPTVCFGLGVCTLCHVRVLSGADHLSAQRPSELATLGPILRRYADARPSDIRLACQSAVLGDVTVFKRGVSRDGGSKA